MPDLDAISATGLRTYGDISVTDHRGFDTHPGNRQSAVPMRSAICFIVFVLALGACGSKGPVNADASPGADGQWVCQPAGDSWRCDQGDEPKPNSAPSPSSNEKE